MSLKLLRTDLNILNMKSRLPFKYGIATLTALPHLLLRVELKVNGRICHGISADGLAPKWFTKNPVSSFEDDITEMFMVIKKAVALAEEIGEAADVFTFWEQLYELQSTWGKENNLPSLLTSFGISLVERALIDAFCRSQSRTFHSLLLSGGLGFRLERIHPHLENELLQIALPGQPLSEITVRQTVGLSDPVTNEDIPPEEVVDDGLPQSLIDCIVTYGITKLKIKISGDLEKDVSKLTKISALIESVNPSISYTLDGNEQFTSAVDFRNYWSELNNCKALNIFLKKLIFVEQPIHRKFALCPETYDEFLSWDDRPPVIIDESDSTTLTASEALGGGYSGTSHKNCKGVFKSVGNACLMFSKGGILSAEDLCNVGPVALQQDLAVAASLGISHVERNGHHYMPGLSMFPGGIQEKALSFHGDLYKSHRGYPSLNITNGNINTNSTVKSPFGLGFDLDSRQFISEKDWSFNLLGL